VVLFRAPLDDRARKEIRRYLDKVGPPVTGPGYDARDLTATCHAWRIDAAGKRGMVRHPAPVRRHRPRHIAARSIDNGETALSWIVVPATVAVGHAGECRAEASSWQRQVIGSCYACGGPCTRQDSTRVKDETVGVRRLVIAATAKIGSVVRPTEDHGGVMDERTDDRHDDRVLISSIATTIARADVIEETNGVVSVGVETQRWRPVRG